jgi:hypothetical protein
MNQLTEAYVDNLAMNASAIKNGKDLVKKNSFPKLCVSEDQTLLFGECKGSGKEPYRCSIDFTREAEPVFRCSCPSRQFPCKHLLGLMYSYTAGKSFDTAPIPEDILDKREKAGKREEKKKEKEAQGAGAAPVKRKTNKAALVKKINAQLEGISILEKLVLQIVQSGLGSMDKKTLQTLEEQAKQLGNYYIPGIQSAARELLLLLRSGEDKDAVYTEAVEQLLLLNTLVKKSRDYLQSRAEQPDQPPDTESTIEEWIGHAWQLSELKEYGRAYPDRKLLQLGFRSYSDHARGEYVDEGYWSDLSTGQIHVTRTYRPFRAAKYIREEDSFFELLQVKELYMYPGELNSRVRWEEAVPRSASSEDFRVIRSHAHRSVAEAVKLVKQQIKNPLSEKHPVLLIAYVELKLDAEGAAVLLDEQGKQLRLSDIQSIGQRTTHLLSLLQGGVLRGQSMLVMLEHDMKENRLNAQPLSIVTDEQVIRLLY